MLCGLMGVLGVNISKFGGGFLHVCYLNLYGSPLTPSNTHLLLTVLQQVSPASEVLRIVIGSHPETLKVCR